MRWTHVPVEPQIRGMTTLYFSPLACSLATRIACAEAGLPATFVEVERKTRRTSNGHDFHAIHPLGLVPALELDDGSVLFENAAILQYVAEQSPVQLAPTDPLGRARLRQWLSFVGTELHKVVYLPLLEAEAPDGARAYALAKADARLAFVAARLAERDYLLDEFTVADAYLFTVLHWTQVTPLDLGRFPPLVRFLARMLTRPAVARAVAEERDLYAREAAERRGAVRPSTRAVIERFNDVFQRHDPSALEALVADDCVIENTTPAPDGARHVGKNACVALWSGIATNLALSFDVEKVTTRDEHAEIYWRLHHPGGAVRGVNLMRVFGGRIVEARGYVKGA